MATADEQKIIDALHRNWIWVPRWVDSSSSNTIGRIVKFSRNFNLANPPPHALLHCSADTRYKLYINGVRVAVGPARGSPLIWYYDTLDIASYLQVGSNCIEFVVLRYFAASRGAMPFQRTSFPGLTVVSSVDDAGQNLSLDSGTGWTAQTNEQTAFPAGLIDDVFLHINERVSSDETRSPIYTPTPYNFKFLNGELPPWRLRAREIPMPDQYPVAVNCVRDCHGNASVDDWEAFLSGKDVLTLDGSSSHLVEIQAECHSTAFLRWTFQATQDTSVKIKITYSEGYEQEPREYPFFRRKTDRLDAKSGRILGPYDEVNLTIPSGRTVTYEPFWFRTFRIIKLEIEAGPAAVSILSFAADQCNYPLGVRASWHEPHNLESSQIWGVSIRTMRNCMFDGYSDCPFYEQLQYSGDTRVVGLLHYLLSGDDRLMRQAISIFAASVMPEGLTQSRFPSHTAQIVAGFSLLWALQVCDHHLFFGDKQFAKSFLPRIDGVLDFFDRHIDELGLVSGLSADVWQYVDWVTAWGATEDHPDKGVPVAGRKSNRHTYFSMIYAYTLQKVAQLVRDVGRPGYAEEYDARALTVVEAVRNHCFDGSFFTDSTSSIKGEGIYSQHCQVFAVLCGAVDSDDAAPLLERSFTDPRFSKCSYMMQFYALRAFSIAGDEAYEKYWATVWNPWRKMLANNMSTWEEDDVRQRSDCHAWGSVPIYEYCTELAGVQPIAPGCAGILFKPRLLLTDELHAQVALGKDNVARVVWKLSVDNTIKVQLELERAIRVKSQLPLGVIADHGETSRVTMSFSRDDVVAT